MVASIEATALLLREVFPQHHKYLHPEYLDWEYLRSPSGRVIEANLDDGIGRCGHYAVVPQRWMIDGTPCMYALSLNTAVSGRSRGRGIFRTLGRKVVAEALDSGYTALVGVANSKSSHGMVNSLGFDLVGPLTVLVIPPTALRRARSFEVGTVGEMSGWLQEMGRSALPESGARRAWDDDELSQPNPSLGCLKCRPTISIKGSSVSLTSGLKAYMSFTVIRRASMYHLWPRANLYASLR